VSFSVRARFSLNDATRRLRYDLTTVGSREQIAGIYLHRRSNRLNGGVAYVLAKTVDAHVSGTLMLAEAEAADLKAGKCYLAAISRTNPLLSARANLVLPPA